MGHTEVLAQEVRICLCTTCTDHWWFKWVVKFQLNRIAVLSKCNYSKINTCNRLSILQFTTSLFEHRLVTSYLPGTHVTHLVGQHTGNVPGAVLCTIQNLNNSWLCITHAPSHSYNENRTESKQRNTSELR